MVRDLTLDETKHQCVWRGEDIQLTVTEFLLVKALAARPGMVKSRDQLIDAAYGENIYVDDRTIDSHVKRIRKKFRTGDNEFDHIETLYGIGYRYKEHRSFPPDGDLPRLRHRRSRSRNGSFALGVAAPAPHPAGQCAATGAWWRRLSRPASERSARG
jgi:hypothetical protein